MNLVLDNHRQGERYTEEFKAAVLADVQLLGAGAAAAKYDLNRDTVYRWVKQYAPLTVSVLRNERIGALLSTYLEANLQALAAQAYVAADPDYLNRQPAESIAVLHRVLGDQAIRLLEAINNRVEEPQFAGPAAADHAE